MIATSRGWKTGSVNAFGVTIGRCVSQARPGLPSPA
jgi:hypothetical protein